MASELFPSVSPSLPVDFTVFQTVVTDKDTRTTKVEGGDFWPWAKWRVTVGLVLQSLVLQVRAPSMTFSSPDPFLDADIFFFQWNPLSQQA